ncbi:MAG TPA: hypothetical protein VI306_09285 [Pyrinomonadaceae bacterium]
MSDLESLILDPQRVAELMRLHEAVNATARPATFELPTAIQQKFLQIHSFFISKPQHELLRRLTVEGGARSDWLTSFLNAVLMDVQEGLACCYYHLHNLEEIESQVIATALSEFATIEFKPGSGVGGGNTRKLNFEYQAFNFAIRRTLEYLAKSINLFFKREGTSFKRLAHTIRGADAVVLSDSVIERTEKLREELKEFFSEGQYQSVRDTLAHIKTIPAGHLFARPFQNAIEVKFSVFDQSPDDADFATERVITTTDSTVFGFLRITPSMMSKLTKVENAIFELYELIGIYSTAEAAE